VALEFLPEAVAGDADRLARFEREAQFLASLKRKRIDRGGCTCGWQARSALIVASVRALPLVGGPPQLAVRALFFCDEARVAAHANARC
jgi:hypothetical protein